MRDREAAALVLTAHHADDQAETVLFRALRGTGIRGLAGIPELRGPYWRPLLGFHREELETYARAVGLRWRDDPSNRDVRFARNELRHRVLPFIEAGAAPHARRALLGLAHRARQEEEGWESLLPGLFESLDLEREEGRISLLREALLRHHPAVKARLLRALARELGGPLQESGTRTALEFTSSGSSGQERHLSGTLSIRREFERLVFVRGRSPEGDRSVMISGPGTGTGRLVVGGRAFDVRWGEGFPPGRGSWEEAFALGDIRFPLQVRGWAPGDRLRLAYGTKKLKKLFLEERIPAGERHRVPVVVDASGAIVWVAGVARSSLAAPASEGGSLQIGIADAETD
jgi:tRNA(Ile)-lysidine synthase